jgi:predicted ArsR family transcriptional regulator
MLQALITSKTRIKLLMKFFLNSRNTSYLRNLAAEYGESTNAIRVELNRMEEAGLLEAKWQDNKKIFRANKKHPLFDSIQQLLFRHTGIDRIVDHVVSKLGGLQQAYLCGSFARGVDSEVIELLLTGTSINSQYLQELTEKAQQMIDRKISYRCTTPKEAEAVLKDCPAALLLYDSSKEGE